MVCQMWPICGYLLTPATEHHKSMLPKIEAALKWKKTKLNVFAQPEDGKNKPLGEKKIKCPFHCVF